MREPVEFPREVGAFRLPPADDDCPGRGFGRCCCALGGPGRGSARRGSVLR
ncbi:hypothetical protein H6B26_29050, partial [Bacillus cereus]|nr:hypothetical protein [Bacillus cereus]